VDEVFKLLSTAAAGALDVWVGIITGVALGLSPVLSGAVSIASAIVGVTLVVAVGGRFLLALALGAPPRSLLWWMLASVVFWGAVLTGGVALGFSIFSP
jgi:hypothetical protein